MVSEAVKIILWTFLAAVNTSLTTGCPVHATSGRSDEIPDLNVAPVTLDVIKRKLRETGVLDTRDPALTPAETKELNKLFDVIEIMLTSRARQPASVQNVFASLRLLERVVKKQLKEGHISQTLAAKFHWDKLLRRQKRAKPMFYLDKKTNMRIFNRQLSAPNKTALKSVKNFN